MPTETIQIIVQGVDKASSPLSKVGGALSQMGTIAGGILTAGLLTKLADGIAGLGSQAMDAVGKSQALELGLTGLLSKQKMFVSEGGQWVATGVKLADAMQMAGTEAKDLMAWTERLAIASPFETQDVQMVTRLGLAANMSTKQVKDFTGAFLDYSAVAGITGGDLTFAADQFLQLRKSMTLSEIDLRQLRRLGIDVAQVLGVEMGMSVDEFNKQVKTSPELMDRLFESFVKFSGETTAGATARMAQTLPGMMSTAQDIITIGSKNLFQPLVESLTPALSALLGNLTSIVTGPQVQAIGGLMGQTIASALSGQWPVVVENVKSLAVQLGADPAMADAGAQMAARLIGAFQQGGLSGLGQQIGGDIQAAIPIVQANLFLLGNTLNTWFAQNAPQAGALLDRAITGMSAWVSGPGQPQLQAAGEAIGRGLGAWVRIEFVEGQLAMQVGAWIAKETPALVKAGGDAGIAIASGLINGFAAYILGEGAAKQLKGSIDSAVKGAMAGLNPAYGVMSAAAGVGINVPGFTAPARAAGGPVSAGRAYTVGERGPELFVPRQAGEIAPSGNNAPIVVIVQSVLDGRVIAESTARILGQDAQARARMGSMAAL